MTQQIINIGTSINDGTGDSLRNGAQKINDNFTELYTASQYILPTASTTVKGGVVVDGETIEVVDGYIRVKSAYSLPTASTSTLGGVKVDGITITVNEGVISALATTPYSLPTASTSTLGGVKVDGTTITITNGIISGANTYVLPTATNNVKGGIKVDGTTITINNDIISISSNIVNNGNVVFQGLDKGIIFGDGTTLKSADLGPYLTLNGDQTAAENNIYNLTVQIGAQTNELNGLEGQLQPLQSQLSYWNSQPDFFGPGQPNNQKFAMISQLNGQISNLQMALGLQQGVVNNLTSQLAIAEEGLLNSDLNFYYNATIQQLLIDNGASSTVKFPNGIVFGDNTLQTTAYTLPTAGIGSGGTLGGVRIDGTSIVINEGIISVAQVGDQSLDTTDDVEFVSVTADSFISTGAGIPTLTSSTNIKLTAANVVVVTSSPFRLASFTTTQRDLLTAINGDMIYNTTLNKFQGYENGAWVNLI